MITYITNAIFFSCFIFIELLLIRSALKLIKVAYFKGVPKYNTYYLLISLTSMIISNAFYLLSFNHYLFPNIFSFRVVGYNQIAFNVFNLIALFFHCLYLIRNITFTTTLFQKHIIVFLEISLMIYLVFLPVSVNGDIIYNTYLENSVFNLIFGMGQIKSLPQLNSFLTLFLCFFCMSFTALFIYLSRTISYTKNNTAVFHEYFLFLIYCLTVFLLNVVDFTSSYKGVLLLISLVIISFRIYFFGHIYRKVITKVNVLEGCYLC